MHSLQDLQHFRGSVLFLLFFRYSKGRKCRFVIVRVHVGGGGGANIYCRHGCIYCRHELKRFTDLSVTDICCNV